MFLLIKCIYVSISLSIYLSIYLGKPGGCVAYSIGSNDKWDFEENFYKDADCAIETFDCMLIIVIVIIVIKIFY
jgi:hypothetical protein